MQDQINLLENNVKWLIDLHNSSKKTNCDDTKIQLLNLHQINSQLEKELSVLTLRLEEKYENLSLNNINLQDNTCYKQLEKCKDKLIKLNSLLDFCEKNKITLEKQILTLKSNNDSENRINLNNLINSKKNLNRKQEETNNILKNDLQQITKELNDNKLILKESIEENKKLFLKIQKRRLKKKNKNTSIKDTSFLEDEEYIKSILEDEEYINQNNLFLSLKKENNELKNRLSEIDEIVSTTNKKNKDLQFTSNYQEQNQSVCKNLLQNFNLQNKYSYYSTKIIFLGEEKNFLEIVKEYEELHIHESEYISNLQLPEIFEIMFNNFSWFENLICKKYKIIKF
jgi:hypothetical protein